MKTSSTITLFTSALSFHYSNAFVDMAMPLSPAVAPAISPEVLSSFPPEASGIGSSSTLEIANAFALPAHAAASVISSPEIESQFLEDMAHVALDFSGFFRPTKKAGQLYSIGGRLMSLMADYLPDHAIRGEDLLVHLFFMGMTLKEMLVDDDLEVVF